MKPHYSDEEANDILRRAIEKMPDKPAMSLQELEKIGAEIGVSPEALRQAEAEHRAEAQRRAHYDRFVAFQRASFKADIWHYVAINIFMLGLGHFLIGYWICGIVALCMGFNLFKKGIEVYSQGSQEHIDAYNKWLKQNQPKVLPPGGNSKFP